MPIGCVKVASGGLAVSQAPTGYGTPFMLAPTGVAVTVVSSGGLSVADAGTGLFAPVVPPTMPTLSNYAFQYEADNKTLLFQDIAGTTTPVANTGDPVGMWKDTSATAYNIAAGAADTTRPTWNTASGISWVQFDGVNDNLRSTVGAGLYAAGNCTISMALRGNPTSGTKWWLLVETNSASANDTYGLQNLATPQTSAAPFIRNGANTLVLNNVPVCNNAFTNTDTVVTWVDAGSMVYWFLDGQLVNSLNNTRSGTLTLNTFGFGSYFRAGTASGWFNTRLYNAFAVKSTLTRDQIRQSVKYQAYKQGRTLTPPTPMFGTNSGYFLYGMYVDVGTGRFLFEKTQAWSCSARVRIPAIPAANAVIATNVTTATAYPGIDFLFVNGSGQLHVRLINNISTSFVGVHGSTNVCDGNPHTLLATYDGSGVAAGVKLYVDGVPETLVTESDNLGSNLVYNANQHTVVGNQLNHLDYYASEVALFRLYSVAKNAAWATTYANGQAPVTSAENCILAYNFQEGVGSTTADLSPSGYTGTLNTEYIWYV